MRRIVFSKHVHIKFALAMASSAAIIVGAAEPAHGQSALHTPAEPQPPGVDASSQRRRASKGSWYGWQTLIGHGLSVIVPIVLIAVPGAEHAIIPVGIAGQMLGPPIVHWSHGNVKKGFMSLGLTAGLPLTLATTSVLLECSGKKEYLFCRGPGEIQPWVYVGMIALTAGFVTGTAIDTAALAYGEPTVKKGTNAMLLPTFDPRTGQTMLNFGLTF